MDGSDDPTSAAPPIPSRPSHNPLPFREDCWSEDATLTLIEAWGDRYIELNRGNLRQKHWQEVADAVNARHGANKKARRTDVQCKNRIDTLKKKYKVEKARILASNGTLTSKWPFYYRLDGLIGSNVPAKKSSPPLALPLPYRKIPSSLPHAAPVPLQVRSSKEKQPSPAVDDSIFGRNFSAAAAAAAANDDVDSGSSRSGTESRRRDGDMNGFLQLAQAITRFGEIYERVEGAKQRQMVELENQRMQFAKDLEFQRMQLFMDTQVQLEKVKRTKRAAASEDYTYRKSRPAQRITGDLQPPFVLPTVATIRYHRGLELDCRMEETFTSCSAEHETAAAKKVLFLAEEEHNSSTLQSMAKIPLQEQSLTEEKQVATVGFVFSQQKGSKRSCRSCMLSRNLQATVEVLFNGLRQQILSPVEREG